jgi:uncharacterized LabA/DUF88 family protein
MDRPAKDIVSRLGSSGLTRALGDLLDQPGLIALANASGVHYPGMRTQSQTRSRLLADLAERAATHEDAQKAIVRALVKVTAKPARDWARLPAEEKARRLSDDEFLLTRGNLGLHLYLLAATPAAPETDGLVRERLARLAANGLTPGAQPERKDARQERRVKERDKKLQYLESQFSKLRESTKAVKRDLIQRKGELAESRMLVERLRRELAQALSAAEAVSTATATRAPVDPEDATAKALRKLATEQKKVQHLLEKQAERPAERKSPVDLGPIVESIERLRKDLTAETESRKRDLAAHAKRLETRLAEIHALDDEPQASAPAAVPRPRRSRAKGPGDRVGVFIDVQNMYYGARQLKGKLDFDALLEAAVRGRRLIKATAYVVESKETDQSQFIAVLEKRAIEVRRKNLQIRADGSMKGDWDMELALDILDAAAGLDVVVLVSGDGDFTSLVKRVKTIGPRVEVVAFPRHTAKSLVGAADHFQPLDRKFMIYDRHPKPESDHPAPAVESPAAAER